MHYVDKLRMMSTYALRCRCNVYIQYDAYIHAYSSCDTFACVYLWYSVHLKMTTVVEWTKRDRSNLATGRVACHLVRLDFAMFAWFLDSFRAPSLRLLFFVSYSGSTCRLLGSCLLPRKLAFHGFRKLFRSVLWLSPLHARSLLAPAGPFVFHVLGVSFVWVPVVPWF